MKNSRRKIVPAVLMAASLVLLAAFQAFWLRKEYFEQKNLLQKEAFLLFQSTVQALEDSVLQQKVSVSFREQKVEKKKGSSLKKRVTVPQKSDTLLFFKRRTAAPTDFHEAFSDLQAREMKIFKSRDSSGDSLTGTLPARRVFVRDSAGYTNIEVRIMASTDKLDSVKQMMVGVLKPIQSRILSQREDSSVTTSPPGHRFVIRLGNDSLKLGDLRTGYAQRLQKANLNLPFTVRRSPGPATDSLSGTLPTLSVMSSSSMPMGSKYSASLAGYRSYLFRKVMPQILVSVFLLAITALAFAVIYRTMQRQQRLMALKNDFISNVTHELKTPIATVSVALEALQNFGAARDPEKIREYLAVSKTELDRLAMLVDKVLKIAQQEQHSLTLSPEPLDMDQLVQQVLHTMKPQFEKYGAQYRYERDGEEFGLMADRVHLTHVLYNLLDNALKYSQGAPEITVRLGRQSGYLRLEVADRGMGIPEAYRHKIFEKFFRVPTGNTHDVKGYGLGLSYAASVLKAHRGRIEVESELGQGSRFMLFLPLTPSQVSSYSVPPTHDPHQTTVR